MSAVDAEAPAQRNAPVLPALLLMLLTLVLGTMPDWARLPKPTTGLSFEQAELAVAGQPAETVRLPHSFHPAKAGAASVAYEIVFILPEIPSQPQEIYIPALRHDLSFTLNGNPGPLPLVSPWMQPSQGITLLLRVPPNLFVAGANRLRLELTRAEGQIPFYLSAVHLGPVDALGQSPWFAMLQAGQARIAAVVLHMVVVLGLITLWTARRHDPVFRWLALLGCTTLAVTFLEMEGATLAAATGALVSLPNLLLGSFGLIVLGLALALAEQARPPWLIHAVWILPLALLGGVRLLPAWPMLAVLVSVAIALGGYLGAALVLIIGFWRQKRWTMGLLAVPFLLVGWIGLRDFIVVLGLRDAPFLLSSYLRPLTMLAIVVLLMRRLATSLNSLDRANDDLRQRLAEQQSELSALHERERRRAAQTVREDERQRLTLDLHDGLSGHLVSIIALSERGADHKIVEGAARAALDDLRLVINSLDIGDQDLPLAMAGFREKLEPQLRRLGVALDWSMEKLPDISGVTPGNALSVLRILQEAVTNALKHGTSRTIQIQGRSDSSGAAITIGNDAAGDDEIGAGHGLNNMRRRAEALGGHAQFERDANQALLTLRLPLRLPDR